MPFLLRHAFWIAPLISFVGFVSYFLVFARYPLTRDFPVVNLPLVFLALMLASIGFRWAWSTGKRGKRILHGLGSIATCFFGAVLVWYVFSLSYELPAATEEAGKMTEAPSFSLPNAKGEEISLASMQGSRVLLVFYRGFW